MVNGNRIIEIDALRGGAIIAMMIYHFIFDLNFLGIVPINIYELPILLFQRSIGTLFLLLVGVSLTLSESGNNEGYRKHAKRGLLLAAIALIITIATWIYPNRAFISFGIIHLIALSTFIAPFFFKFGKWNYLIGILIVLFGLYCANIYASSDYLFWLGLKSASYEALDYYPVLPWFGIVLIGIPMGKLILEIKRKSSVPTNIVVKLLMWLGRRSLQIYLVHQPIIIGILIAYLIIK
ncbi:DUF1624 domain-containing protein, partial [Candidatus Micrarchaeota archaeon]|nr:DUF1624 domain-containing protein [Candidatus Micrarchaeota archaeon]